MLNIMDADQLKKNENINIYSSHHKFLPNVNITISTSISHYTKKLTIPYNGQLQITL